MVCDFYENANWPAVQHCWNSVELILQSWDRSDHVGVCVCEILMLFAVHTSSSILRQQYFPCHLNLVPQISSVKSSSHSL